MAGWTRLSRWYAALALLELAAVASAGALPVDPTLEELKQRLSATSISERPHLCVEIAHQEMLEADKLYATNDFDKAQTSLTQVVAYSELARDYSIQSHKHQKQTEIAVREIARKLTDLMRSLPHDNQSPVREAIRRLQRVRDDLLIAMFPKGAR